MLSGLDYSTTKRLPRSTSLINFNATSLATEFAPSKSFSSAQVSYGRKRRRSLNEKLLAKEEQQNRAFCFCLSIRILILLIITVFILYRFCVQRLFVLMMHDISGYSFQTTSKAHSGGDIEINNHIYPSLNVLDYWDFSYPIFPSEFPYGISRKEMPQLVSTSKDKGILWKLFEEKIKENGGSINLYRDFDLRRAKPLESQISGNILYNVVLEALKQGVSQDFFKSRIVLVKSSRQEKQNNGGFFPVDTFFILDGHHTTFASILCAVPQTKLRLGNLYQGSTKCGKYFDTKQDIHVIEGLALLEVREIAIATGASTGQGLSFSKNSSTSLV